jgi:hypothetical protein
VKYPEFDTARGIPLGIVNEKAAQADSLLFF